jgi:mannose/fructose/N-acetylgalactosamine-specific phosphotransferase system component IIC
MPPRFWWSLATAALLNLDRQAFGQLALSRPLVVGGLVGLALGQAPAGLALGLWTELLWLARPPLGGTIPPNGGLAVSAALLGFTIVLEGPPELLAPLALPPETEAPPHPADPLAPGAWTALWVLAFATIPPMARIMTGIETIARRRSVTRAKALKEAIIDGEATSLMAFQVSGLLVTLGLTVLFLLGGLVAVGALLSLALAALPPWAWPPLDRLGPLMPVVGVAIMTDHLAGRHLAIFGLALAASMLLAALGPLP